jgi:hypothetical protein
LEASVKRTEGDSPDRRLNTGAPRWVKVFGIIVIVLVLLFVVLHVSGHGFGGHGMNHMGHGVKPS